MVYVVTTILMIFQKKQILPTGQKQNHYKWTRKNDLHLFPFKMLSERTIIGTINLIDVRNLFSSHAYSSFFTVATTIHKISSPKLTTWIIACTITFSLNSYVAGIHVSLQIIFLLNSFQNGSREKKKKEKQAFVALAIIWFIVTLKKCKLKISFRFICLKDFYYS